MSDYFQWDPAKFSLDVAAMDREHQVLIGHMNTLHRLYVSNAPSPEQGKAFKTLADYTVKHFADEERYMEGIGYPGLRIHKGVHQNLLERVGHFGKAFAATGRFGDDLFVFLRMWLSAHICGVDMKYSAHAHEAHGASAGASP